MRPPPARLVRVVAAVLATVLGLATPGSANQQAAPEYAIKAAYLYNFATFVAWPTSVLPATAASSLTICVLGGNPFGSALQEIGNAKRVHGHRLVVVQVDDPRDAADCHLLFVTAAAREAFDAAAAELAGRPLLTVGDAQGFAESGGIIEFVERDHKIRFRVNRGAANRAGLAIDSRLLALAEAVDD